MTEHNQFTDPPIKAHPRTDEPEHEPTFAPSIDTHNSLEAEPTEEERQRGEYTEVTRLYLDRTPND
ncbi:hypothetical protein H7B90_05240 [Cohnella xylanilytica]|uniref:Uncharacterized protein n=1 Tax=Cohnella xylanilytica TaxID=557555 RepID=A0A841TXD7_9BACL|nr:hypothetical protein [Cohnella xylanilytica]MBB6690803.1 hypothetical protein [Cohnella xylanilytica]